MALPEYVLRSYRGGCTYLTLTETIGAGTLSIPVSGTLTNWPTKTLAATTGPFTICLTRGTAKEEKVQCSSLAKNTGIITVWSTGTETGRGFDTTSAHTHAPTSTVQQVVLVWSAAEAREANRAANAILGAPTAHSASATAKANETSICTASVTVTLPAAPLSGTRNKVVAASGTVTIAAGAGSTITWGTSGKSSVQIATGMAVTLVYSGTVWYVIDMNGSRPNGMMVSTAGDTACPKAAATQILHMVSSWLKGGVTLTATTNALVAPIPGVYQAEGYVTANGVTNATVSGSYGCWIYKNGAPVCKTMAYVGTQYPALTAGVSLELSAADKLTVSFYNATTAEVFATPTKGNALPCSLMIRWERP